MLIGVNPSFSFSDEREVTGGSANWRDWALVEGVSLKVSSTARWDDRRWLIGVVGFPSVPLSSLPMRLSPGILAG